MTAAISSAFPATDAPVMTKDLLWRGMLAGILAALLATLFARVVAEPQIDLAIAVEEAHSAAEHAGHAMAMTEPEELVSRATQKGLGLMTAMAAYGAAVGGIFSLVFAYGYGRVARIGPRSFALALALLAFVLVVLIPSIKYPQTPPAVGQHETVRLRTAAYFAMILLSIGAAMIAARLRGGFAQRMRGLDASLVGIGVYGAVVLAGAALLPHVDEVPQDFPATLLWNFRVASIGTQLLLWTTLGLVFGYWTEQYLRRQS